MDTMNPELTLLDDKDVSAGARQRALPPVAVLRPVRQTAPIVLASPHSGRNYTPQFVEASALPLSLLRRSEDAYIDELFAAAPAAGIPLVLAQFPRVFVDPNRAEYELDPLLTGDRSDPLAPAVSPRAQAGLGIVPRLGVDGLSIYNGPVLRSEIVRRIASFHTPYHDALEAEVARTIRNFGFAIVIDAHSMPSISAPGIDTVIGDRHGKSCAPEISGGVEAALQRQGFRTRRNIPYAGGFTTEHYGRPQHGRHAVQIEISRGLYLVEHSVARSGTFESLKHRLTAFIDTIVGIDWRLKIT